jgi:hypothetical protein
MTNKKELAEVVAALRRKQPQIVTANKENEDGLIHELWWEMAFLPPRNSALWIEIQRQDILKR